MLKLRFFRASKSIERQLFITPPKEFRKPRKLWKLNEVVYGLNDASRSWYLRVKEVLLELGMKMCEVENVVFHYDKKTLDGIIIIHVDDMLFAGTENFMNSVILAFKRTFQISKEEESCFKYVGIDVEQRDNCIKLSQKDYIAAMKTELLPKEMLSDKNRSVTPEETKIFRQAVGSLGWVAAITRPEFAYYYYMGTVQSKPKVNDFIRYRKTVKELKSCDSRILIKKLYFKTLRLEAFSDASLSNLTDGSSQLVYIIFLTDAKRTAVPICWASKKSKRVARSTLTAETLAAIEAVDSALVLKRNIEEILKIELPSIYLMVDNKSLYDAVRTSNTLSETRLMIDMSALRQMTERKEVEVKWIATKDQLANVFTKDGADKQKLISVINAGKLDH